VPVGRDLFGARVVAVARADEARDVAHAGLGRDRDGEFAVRPPHVMEDHAGAGVEIPGLHRRYDRLGGETPGADHHPAATAVALAGAEGVVVVRVIRGHGEHDAEAQVGQAAGQHGVPHRVGVEVVVVAGVVHLVMAVVNLEETLAFHLHEFLGRDRPAEVGMVEVREHRLAGPRLLLEDGVEVLLHDLDGGRAGERRQELARVGDVDVNGAGPSGRGGGLRATPGGGNLLARDHQEAPRLLEERAVFVERLEAHLPLAVLLAELDPVRAEAAQVFLQNPAAAATTPGAGMHAHHLGKQPALARLHGVVVGDGEEVIALLLIPVGDHLGIIVAVAPERMGMQVALEPAWFGDGGHPGVRDQRQRERTEECDRRLHGRGFAGWSGRKRLKELP